MRTSQIEIPHSVCFVMSLISYWQRFLPPQLVSTVSATTATAAAAATTINTCVHHMRRRFTVRRFSLCVSRNTWSAHMISLFIYLVLIRWCAKVHSQFFVFFVHSTSPFYTPSLASFSLCRSVVSHFRCRRWHKRTKKKRSANTMRTETNTPVQWNWWEIMNEINLHRIHTGLVGLCFFSSLLRLDCLAILWLRCKHTYIYKTLFGSSTLFIWLFSLLISYSSCTTFENTFFFYLSLVSFSLRFRLIFFHLYFIPTVSFPLSTSSHAFTFHYFWPQKIWFFLRLWIGTDKKVA